MINDSSNLVGVIIIIYQKWILAEADNNIILAKYIKFQLIFEKI